MVGFVTALQAHLVYGIALSIGALLLMVILWSAIIAPLFRRSLRREAHRTYQQWERQNRRSHLWLEIESLRDNLVSKPSDGLRI